VAVRGCAIAFEPRWALSEVLGEQTAGARDTRLHRSYGTAAKRCGFLVGEAARTNQDQGFAILRGKLPERVRQVDHVRRLDAVAGLRVADKALLQGAQSPLARPKICIKAVSHYRKEPGLEVRSGRELGLLGQGREHCVLHQIVGSLALPAEKTAEGAQIGDGRNDIVLEHLVFLDSAKWARRRRTPTPRVNVLTREPVSVARVDQPTQSSRKLTERDMNWDRIEGNWKQMTGKVKEGWGKLTENDITTIAGKRDQLVGRIQERYGIAKDEADRQVKDWESRM